MYKTNATYHSCKIVLFFKLIIFRKFPFVSPCRGVVSLSAEQHGPLIQKRENKDNSLDWILVNNSPTTTLLSNLEKRAEGRRGNILFSKILRKLE